ncbi:hypothetical protein AB9F42_35035, partial [Rhizobium leguminosarum]|uniref:hypothetical protein n=1 Tax=Rhizobium leguminosarum TaxID=384 RepID=UPI003F9B891A
LNCCIILSLNRFRFKELFSSRFGLDLRLQQDDEKQAGDDECRDLEIRRTGQHGDMTVYYVNSETGSDRNGGTGQNSAFATLSK